VLRGQGEETRLRGLLLEKHERRWGGRNVYWGCGIWHKFLEGAGVVNQHDVPVIMKEVEVGPYLASPSGLIEITLLGARAGKKGLNANSIWGIKGIRKNASRIPVKHQKTIFGSHEFRRGELRWGGAAVCERG